MDFKRPETYLDGSVLFIDKPYGWTSFDVVNKIRQSLRYFLGIKKIKVGHAGTLDPLATGLVIICTGKATKRITEFQDLYKNYRAGIRLGATTPSFDLETEVDQTYPWEHISLERIQTTLEEFKGESEQMPPIFSAKSVAGKRAYELAREGKHVELKSQHVVIKEMELLEFSPPDLLIHIECSKGTYVRSLARDIGSHLQSGAYLTSLRRTRIGSYSVDNALSIEDFLENFKLL